MKAVVQRVNDASVTVENSVTGIISRGILVYVGFDIDDTVSDINWMINKLPYLRLFSDKDGKMNLSVDDLDYGILVISQFTLLGSCKKGRRPSYDRAMKPDSAKKMYETFMKGLKEKYTNVQSGVFQAHMDVKYINDGPVTLILDSRE